MSIEGTGPKAGWWDSWQTTFFFFCEAEQLEGFGFYDLRAEMGRIQKGVMGQRCEVSDGAGKESTGSDGVSFQRLIKESRWLRSFWRDYHMFEAFVVLTVTEKVT